VRLGLTFNVRGQSPAASRAPGLASDAEEEFDSPTTIQALADVLRGLGHRVDLLGDGEPLLKRLLSEPRPQLVLNIAEGTGALRSREARVPALLEMLEVAYTGSDPLTLAATLDKDCAKRLVSQAGVATPPWILWDPAQQSQPPAASLTEQLGRLPAPWIIKPAFEGSSKGVLETSVFSDLPAAVAAVEQLVAAYGQPVLIEEYIDGDELTVGLVGNAPPDILGIMRVIPQFATERFVYSLEVKRDFERRVRYECPAQIGPAATAAVEQAVRTCWQALGCRDVARFDFRLRDGQPYFLECNPLPGLNPHSGDLVLLARATGVEHPELLRRIVAAACTRHGL